MLVHLLATLLSPAFSEAPPPPAPYLWHDIAPAQGIAGAVGQAGTGIGGGVAVFDADGDGALDIAVVSPLAGPRLIRRTPSGWSIDDTALLPDLPATETGGIVTLDMDGDGDRDVLLLRDGPDALLRNDGGMFVDVSATRLPRESWWSVSAAVGDIDGDGDDDVVVANYISGQSFPGHQGSPNRMLLNDGAGRFVDVAAQVGVAGAGCTLALLLADLDGDGDLDLAEANDFGQFTRPNALYRNDGLGEDGLPMFTDISAASGFDRRVYGMGLDAADVNLDGRLDLMTTSIGRGALLVQTGPLVFEDQTVALGAAVPWEMMGFQVTWTPLFVDLDFDGVRDLFMTGGHISAAGFISNGTVQPNVRLGGGPPFVLDPPTVVLEPPEDNRARGLAQGDVTGDGRTDLLVAHAHRLLSVYEAPPSVSLRVRPIPRETGPTPSGATLDASCGEVWRTFWLHGGGAFASASEPVFTVTLPACPKGAQVSLSLRWPSGHFTRATAEYGGPELVIAEPEWLAVTHDLLTWTPSDALAQPVLNLGRLGARLDDGTDLPLVLVGTPPRVEASLPPSAAGQHVHLRVDGRALGAHPVVPGALSPAALRAQPATPIAGRPVSILVSTDAFPPNATVFVGDAPAQVQLSAADPSVGRVVVDAAPPDAPLQVSVRDGDALLATRSWTVGPVVTPSLSRLRVSNRLRVGQDLADEMAVVLTLRDDNGEVAQPGGLAVTLHLGQDVIEPSAKSFSKSQALYLFPTPPGVADGTPYRLWVDGQPFGAEQTVELLASPEQLVPFISLEQSSCGPSMAWVEANGAERVTFVLFLRDAFGNPLPISGPPPTLASDLGFTVEAPNTWTSDDRHQIPVIVGTTPGAAALQVIWNGLPTGLFCRVDVIPPYTTPTALSDSLSSLMASPDQLPMGFGQAELRFTPRGLNGRLAGPGISGVHFGVTTGTVSDARYAGVGFWVGTWTAGAQPAPGTLSVTVDNPALEMSLPVAVYDPAAIPDLGPGPDAGSDAAEAPDAGSAADGGSDPADTPEPPEVSPPDAAPPDDAMSSEVSPDVGPPASDATAPDAAAPPTDALPTDAPPGAADGLEAADGSWGDSGGSPPDGAGAPDALAPHPGAPVDDPGGCAMGAPASPRGPGLGWPLLAGALALVWVGARRAKTAVGVRPARRTRHRPPP